MGLIPDGVNVGENMSLRRSISRGSTKEVLNRGLFMELIEAGNRWINREIRKAGGKG